MGHLGDGALRRMIDEPLAASEADRRHLESCAGCAQRSERLTSEAKAAEVLLGVPGFEADSAAALARVHNLAAVAPAPRRAWARFSWSLPRLAAQGYLPAELGDVLRSSTVAMRSAGSGA